MNVYNDSHKECQLSPEDICLLRTLTAWTKDVMFLKIMDELTTLKVNEAMSPMIEKLDAFLASYRNL